MTPERTTRSALGTVAVIAALGAAACSGTGQPPSTSTSSPAISSASPPRSTGATPATPAKTGKIPDVSGLNHQAAQDTMQAAGFYNLREVDGTGKGRMLLVDRNWVQTGQSPAAGTVAPTDTVVTLTAIKYTDR